MNSYIPIPTPIVMPTRTGGAPLPIWGAWVVGIIMLLLTLALSSILGWLAHCLWDDSKFFSILLWGISVVSFVGLLALIIAGIIIPAYG